MLKVAVGSKNPIKIEAVKKSFEKVFNSNIEVIDVSVSSDVSDMPMSFKEMLKGAKNRASRAMEKVDADFGVGLEGGFEDEEIGTFLSGFVAIVNRQGVWGYSKRRGLFMPEKIVKKTKEEKKELGDVMDEMRGMKNTKQHEGCVGFMTDNLIPRQKELEGTIIYALSRFTRKEMFE
jgi:inosine/xanthosine triphosphatase